MLIEERNGYAIRFLIAEGWYSIWKDGKCVHHADTLAKAEEWCARH